MKGFTRADVRKIIGENCTDEMETAILALHHGVVDSIKDELDTARSEAAKYKAEADKLPDIQKQLESSGDYKAKYEKEHHAYEEYKKQIADGEELTRKKAAYRKLLAEENINEKRLDAVIRLTDFSGMKLDKDGKLEDVEDLRKNISKEWGEYKVTTQERGADVGTPPEMGKGGRTRQEILAIKDTAERQKAIAENHQLFGF